MITLSLLLLKQYDNRKLLRSLMRVVIRFSRHIVSGKPTGSTSGRCPLQLGGT